MTFGLLKSIIEQNLLESYKDEKNFKKAINEFKHNVLNNKNLSKIYSIYDDLTKPQNLSKEDAKEFLDEGIQVIRSLIPHVKLPKNLSEEKTTNKYKNLDSLVYIEHSGTNLKERIEIKKQFINLLSSKETVNENKINIPLSSMVKIANQTLKNYIENLDESSKKEFFELIKEDAKILENKFEDLKKIALEKLSPIMENENNLETKNRIEETINKIREDKFDQINYLKLKNLINSL